MRLTAGAVALILTGSCAVLQAQQWEVGASAGYGAFRDAAVSNGSVSGKAGFANGVAFGALFGNNISRHFGGEVRYTYRDDNLKLTARGQEVTAGAESHALHYDVLVHAAKEGASVRPFVAAGAGVKYFRGTGAEPSFQPNSDIAVLTHASEATPLVSVGGGVKCAVSRRTRVRLDFRDYATPVPTKLIAPRQNVKFSGWMHDFVFMVGISYAL